MSDSHDRCYMLHLSFVTTISSHIPHFPLHQLLTEPVMKSSSSMNRRILIIITFFQFVHTHTHPPEKIDSSGIIFIIFIIFLKDKKLENLQYNL